ncbi:MAG TPA: methyl-accepting chemotaxis protein [Chloroflexia bacterium]|nr:methyl-accepting chemotaxis protein [Chloroflexia bacterium]
MTPQQQVTSTRASGVSNSGPATGNTWRSSLFWRMMSGALVAFLTMLLTAGLSIGIIGWLVRQTNEMHTVFSTADRLQRFSTGVTGLNRALELLAATKYNPRFYTTELESLTPIRTDLAARITARGTQSDQLADLRPLIPAGRMKALETLLSDFDALSPELKTLNDKARTDQGGALMSWQQNYAGRLQALESQARTLADELTKDAATRQDTMRTAQDSAIGGIIIIGAGGLVLGLVLTLAVLGRTVRRIASITGDIQRLASGDLMPPRRLRPQAGRAGAFTDEVVTLEQAYLRTLQTLRDPLQRIQGDAARISASSSEISNAAHHQAIGSTQQATAITEVTVTVEQLNQTAVQISDAAASVASAAEQALVSASRGQEAVRDSIIGMAMIRSRVNDITARILALSAQSQRISEIIDVIDEMASRTHILALNAAVESASAGGEAGERFGVVASEVKKLAQRSAGATREVRAVITQVQAATNAAVMATEDGLKETEKGVQMAHQSGDANEDIIQMVERTAQLANAISLATQQQRTASEQVVATMREIAQVTRQAAASSQQASRAATELSEIAHELSTVSDAFQTAPGPGAPPDAGAGSAGTLRLTAAGDAA